jgi:hypothetical protein
MKAYDISNPGGVSASVTIHVNTHMVYYVNSTSTNPIAPYGTWETAATNIQDAIDAAMPVPQSLVIVTNGVYQTGGRVAYGSLTNRVMVSKPITVQSLNGPAVTLIRGNGAIGDGAVRCVYLTNNSVLNGFTITHGATRSSGDPSRENSGGGIWCESSTAIISNCVLVDNSAVAEGGGVYAGTLNSSMLCSNNTAFVFGSGNGGGASSAVLNGCWLFNNFAGESGGGANNCTLNNSALANNIAGGSGGGANSCTLNNCTLTGNNSGSAGGANSCNLNNCIACYNSASSELNYSGGTLNYCCTVPLPVSGSGNTTAEPRLTDLAHISTNSPCLRTGSTNYVSGADIDGDAWLTPPSIGCDEYYNGPFAGPLNVSTRFSYTNATAGFAINCFGTVVGHAVASIWNFGDGTTSTNQIFVSHSWSSSGTYSVVLTAYNSDNSGGISSTTIVHVAVQPVQYVCLLSSNPVPPYLSWNTAATNIQDAVDTAFGGGTILVSNGVYSTGGRIVNTMVTNRVVIDRIVKVQSVNGSTVTTIQGGDAVRCVYLASGASLAGFTLTNGMIQDSGGGAWCESTNALISDCVLVGNTAGDPGGGSCGGTLIDCLLSGNSPGGASGCTLVNCMIARNRGDAVYSSLANGCAIINNLGPGAYTSILNNCTVVSNTTDYYAGGTIGGTNNNCIIYANQTTFNGPVNYYYGTLNYCCTTPLPSGLGNFTNTPSFVDFAGGNLRLQSNSPCINAGNNLYVSGTKDLDGRARIVQGTVDIGAYEFQGPGIGEFTGWLQQSGLPTDGSGDFIDTDHDGMNNWQEWIAGTDPTSPSSVLKMLPGSNSLSGISIRWQSVTNRTYFLTRSTNLSAKPAFSVIQSNISGQTEMTSLMDGGATNSGPYFYRVGVQQ